MIGSWNIPEVEDHDQFAALLAHLTDSGHGEAVMFMEVGKNQDDSPMHIVYFLVCTDPDGEWFWLNDPTDSGWTDVHRNSLDLLPIVRRNITLMVSH